MCSFLTAWYVGIAIIIIIVFKVSFIDSLAYYLILALVFFICHKQPTDYFFYLSVLLCLILD